MKILSEKWLQISWYLILPVFFFLSCPSAFAAAAVYSIDKDGDGYGVGIDHVTGPDADDTDPWNGNGVYLNGTTQYDWGRVHDISVKNIEDKNTKSGVRGMVNIDHLYIENCVLHDTASHNIYPKRRKTPSFRSGI